MKLARFSYLACLVLATSFVTATASCTRQTPEIENVIDLLDIPANKWVTYHETDRHAWWPSAHAGAAYDIRRGSILVFGSGTHGEGWDNAVHEFSPTERKWTHHYTAADQSTYRKDEGGNAIAGDESGLPWAMHTYDGVQYDPTLDALVVAARPQHNPKIKSLSSDVRHPTWIYDLEPRRWRVLDDDRKGNRNFFGAATAYNDSRDTVVAYKKTLWELGPDRTRWRRVGPKGPHSLHHSLVYDSWRRRLFVFGFHSGGTAVWSYTPAILDEDDGLWQEYKPGGDPCPPYSSVPVAFDRQNGVFLLVVDDKRIGSASTYVYFPDTNVYKRIPGAELPPVGMNFRMVWHRDYRLFFLVTGGRETPVAVRVLRLNLASLERWTQGR